MRLLPAHGNVWVPSSRLTFSTSCEVALRSRTMTREATRQASRRCITKNKDAGERHRPSFQWCVLNSTSLLENTPALREGSFSLLGK